MFKWLKNILFKPILDFIYPPICFLCNNYLEFPELCICSDCWSQFKKVEADSRELLLLTDRFRIEGIIDKFTSLYVFEKNGKFQEVIHLLKYRNIKAVGIRLGRELGLKIVNEFSKIDFLTAVPLHKLKLRERGYNQVDYICRGISEMLGIEFKRDIIFRTRYTKTQTELNFQERKENVKDAFCVNKKYLGEIKNKNVLIIDDVITTGATITAAGQVLKQSGFKSIFAASVGLASL